LSFTDDEICQLPVFTACRNIVRLRSNRRCLGFCGYRTLRDPPAKGHSVIVRVDGCQKLSGDAELIPEAAPDVMSGPPVVKDLTEVRSRDSQALAHQVVRQAVRLEKLRDLDLSESDDPVALFAVLAPASSHADYDSATDSAMSMGMTSL
jgi:hypothetical protein